MAYELMQTKHIDASQKYYSLDDIYYFGGELPWGCPALWCYLSLLCRRSEGPQCQGTVFT